MTLEDCDVTLKLQKEKNFVVSLFDCHYLYYKTP